MQRITLAMVFMTAVSVQAQTPAHPTPPAPPAPRPARPVPAPRAVRPMDFPDVDQLNDEMRRAADAVRDANFDTFDTIDMQQMREQLREAARDARNIDMDQIREQTRMAQEDARLALAGVRDGIPGGVSFGVFDGIAPVAPIAPMPPMRFEYAPTEGWMNVHPRAPWAQGDPADSLYRVARDTFNRGDYRRAADLFANLAQKFPRSAYADDAAYFEAYARYRLGSTEDLKAAAKAIEPFADKAADGPRRGYRDNDAPALYARINHALALRGDKDAAARIEKQATQGGAACDQEELAVQAEALNALSEMDPNAALTPLRRVLERKDECSASLRRNAIFILARRADTSAATLLLATAKNDPSADVRANAINWLPRLAGDAGVTALEEMLRTDSDPRIQRAAVRALMSADSPKARQSMRALIERKDAPLQLRMEAINGLNSDHATNEDAAFLRSLFAQADDDRLKATIVNAVARIGGNDNDQWLLSIAKNGSESSAVRAAAVSRLSRSSISIGDLSKLYDQADSRGLRDQLINLLETRQEPEATDKLIDIAKNSTDLTMRTRAIHALTRKKDPRAQKALLDLIDKTS